jgi:hypothetical protein
MMSIRPLRRLIGVALTWAVLWLTLWSIVGVIIGLADPDSLDPEEGALILVIFGPMGLFTGVVFGLLLSIGARGTIGVDRPAWRVAALGVAATAIVQVAYLGHGDQGLAANIKMALLFSAIGGVVTTGWLALARRCGAC